MSASTATSPRRFIRDTAVIGTRWRRRSDGQVFVVRQRHTADRQVEMLPELDADARPTLVGFADLRRRYELLIDPEGLR